MCPTRLAFPASNSGLRNTVTSPNDSLAFGPLVLILGGVSISLNVPTLLRSMNLSVRPPLPCAEPLDAGAIPSTTMATAAGAKSRTRCMKASGCAVASATGTDAAVAVPGAEFRTVGRASHSPGTRQRRSRVLHGRRAQGPLEVQRGEATRRGRLARREFLAVPVTVMPDAPVGGARGRSTTPPSRR